MSAMCTSKNVEQMIFNAMNLKVNEVQKANLNLFSLNNFVLAPTLFNAL